MKGKTNSAVKTGLTLGIVFLVFALIPDSRWFPLILPLLGGASATYLTGKKTFVSGGEGFKLGATTGIVAGLIVVVLGAPITYLVVSSFLHAQLSQAEAQRGFLAVLVGLMVPVWLIFVLSTVGGAAAVPLFNRRRH